ncbi:MAG: hypothetical protein Q9218_002578 [Villophora microphyllina]
MSDTVSLQADVGNLSLAGLNSFRSVLSALSTDDVQPSAMLQVQDIGSLFHANGKFASTVSDELQRSPSHRLDMLSCAIGWRKGDASSLLAQSAGGQAAALLALFLRNTYDHRTAGDILYRFSQRYMPRSRCVASVKQLAEVLTKVSGKIASMGYSNFLAEQATKLRLAYLQSNLTVPCEILDDMTEEGTVEMLGVISRAQREADTRARITGIRSVGHIMTFLLVLCAEDIEISVEGTVIHGGSNKRIFLEVVAGPDDRFPWHAPTKFQLETTVKMEEFVDIPVAVRLNSAKIRTFSWKGWLAARLDLLLFEYGSLNQDDLITDCCNFIWNLFRTEEAGDMAGQSQSWSPALDSLGPQARQRMQEALDSMFLPQTWVPRMEAPEVIADRMIEVFARATARLSRRDHFPSDATSSEHDKTRLLSYAPACTHCARLWDQLVAILADAFAGLYIIPSPKAAVSTLSEHKRAPRMLPWEEKLFTLRYWLQTFGTEDLAVNTNDPLLLLGRWNGSSVLYPTALAQLKMSDSSRLTYQLSDGCFMLNDRYFDNLEAGFTRGVHTYGPRNAGPEMVLDKIIPTRPGASYHIDVTLTESFSAIKIWVRANIDNQITELNLYEIIRCYEQLIFSEPCDHPYATPLVTSRPHRIPANVFESPYVGADQITVRLYMVHRNPQLQFLCLGNGQDLSASRILFMKSCCLNCAFDQAIDKKCRGIVVS